MSLEKLETIISQTPIDSRSGHRLADLVERAQNEGRREYTFDFLIYRVRPKSPAALALAMRALSERGIVQRVVRVESPTEQGGIEDFTSVGEIPREILDWRSDQYIDVSPENVRVIYKILSDD